MTNQEAIKYLRVLRVTLVGQRSRIGRKRSWRLSEKAMAAAAVEQQIKAIDVARQALGEESAQ